MSGLLTEAQWRVLTRLYVAGKAGIPYEGRSYGDAGPWPVLRELRDNDPPLAREVVRLRGDKRGQNFVVITEAGAKYYEDNQRLYNVFYPPG
jgi:hypothetical protein